MRKSWIYALILLSLYSCGSYTLQTNKGYEIKSILAITKAGDTIYSDSSGTTLAATGYYTINALPPDPPYNDSFVNNRQYITVNVQGSGAGVVDGSVPTDQPLFC